MHSPMQADKVGHPLHSVLVLIQIEHELLTFCHRFESAAITNVGLESMALT